MRKLCWWASSCSAAIFLAVYFLPEDWLLPAGIFCALCFVLSLSFRGKGRLKVTLTAFGLAVGLLWTGCYGILFLTPAHLLAEQEMGEYTLTVRDFPKETDWGSSFLAQIHLEGAADPKVQVYADYDALKLQPGDVVKIELKLSPSNYSRGEVIDYYRSRGIYLLGYAQDEADLLRRPEWISPSYWPQWSAKLLKDSIAQVFPDDISGFLTALTTGDKSFLPVGMYSAFQRSGLAHVIAVSGLHIGFLAGQVTILLGKRKRLSLGVGMALVLFYAALAGNTPSALRASFMMGFLLLAPLVGRENDKPTTLSSVLLMLLLPCPYAAASTSLQLSFAAVAGIYLLTGPLYSRWLQAIPKWDKPLGKLTGEILKFAAGTFSTTLGALLFTAPLAAIYYHSVSLAGPLANLFTLWIIAILFLGGLLSALLGLFSFSVGSAVAGIMAWAARWAVWVAESISHWPFASVSLLSGYLIAWFVIGYIIVLLWIFSREKMRPVIPISALILTLCAALLTNAWPAVTGTLTVSVLDVGQGASTLFYSKGHAVLVDCGGNSADDSGDIAADYLQSLGTSRLDALILTHYHADHADGVAELLSRIEVSMLIVPDVTPEDLLRKEVLSLAERYGCKVELLSEDAHITFGSASLEIYAPLGNGGTNEEGLSVLCSAGDFDVLLTGDMNDIVERRLIKYKHLPDIELLIVGHHGSKSSASEELLLAVAPEVAVISVGYNTYGHPALETLERLGAAGCSIYRTDLMGTVTFTFKGE